MRSKTKVTLGLLGAVAAGVVIGLIIAPEKGSETRKRIKRTTDSWVDQLGNIFSKAKEEVEDLKENAKSLKNATEKKGKRLEENLA